jgi:hypothetical protein
LGCGVYKLLRGAADIMGGRAKENNNQNSVGYILANAFNALFMFVLSIVMWKAMGEYNSTFNPDDASTIEKILHIGSYITHFLVALMYYGFAYGLFGGDNCRMQDTPLSKIFDKIKEFGKGIAVRSVSTNIKNVKKVVEDEVSSEKNIFQLIASYFVSSVGKAISSIAEDLSSLTTIYASIKNIHSLFFTAIGMFVIYAIRSFQIERLDDTSLEEMANTISIDPIETITSSFKNFIIIMLILVVVKLVIRLLLQLTPKTFRNKVFDKSYALNQDCQKKLAEMSKSNFETDTCAKTYSNRMLYAASLAHPGKRKK